MAKTFLLIGAVAGALSVAIGAFGAHALKATLEANQRVDTFELASRYQFYHSLAILAVGIVMLRVQHGMLAYAGYSFVVGILIFSGSLYILSLTGKGWLGAITPLGGVALILGWAFLLWGVYQAEI